MLENEQRLTLTQRRLIGRSFSDPEVQQDIKHLPYKVVAGNGDKPVVEVDIGGGEMKRFTPEEISAMILVKMKEVAEGYLGQTSVLPIPHTTNIQLTSTQALNMLWSPSRRTSTTHSARPQKTQASSPA